MVGDLGYFGAEKYYLLKNELKLDGYEEWLETAGGQKRDGYSFMPQGDGSNGAVPVPPASPTTYPAIKKPF